MPGFIHLIALVPNCCFCCWAVLPDRQTLRTQENAPRRPFPHADPVKLAGLGILRRASHLSPSAGQLLPVWKLVGKGPERSRLCPVVQGNSSWAHRTGRRNRGQTERPSAVDRARVLLPEPVAADNGTRAALQVEFDLQSGAFPGSPGQLSL